MPFGLTNILATFMDLVNRVFHKYLDDYIIVSMDILIYFDIEEDHDRHLRRILEVLRESKLYTKRSK